MMAIFLESLLLGAGLATLYFALCGARRMLRSRRGPQLPAGETLHCVQPLDLARR